MRQPEASRGLALSLGLMLMLLPVALAGGVRTASAQAADAVRIRIPITDNGFNDQVSDFAITVEEGQLVELTFVWDHKVYPAEEHIFVLEGYNLETKTINAANREATLRFVADKSGAFRLKCDLECDIHDKLKKATLNVARRGTLVPTGAGARGETRPKSHLLIAAPASVELGAAVQLLTTATDASGAPIAGAKLLLLEVVDFFGATAQEIEVAATTTGADGGATLEFRARRSGTRVLKALLEGDVRHQPASLELQLGVSEGRALYRVEPPAGIPGVNRFFVSGIIVAVWGTMFVVALHVVAITRDGQAAAAGEEERDG